MAPIDRPREADPESLDDLVPARLYALMVTLQAHEFVADLEDDQRLRVSSPCCPGFEVVIRCARRTSDSGQLWFIGPQARPLAEADDITGAVMALKRLTAVRM